MKGIYFVKFGVEATFLQKKKTEKLEKLIKRMLKEKQVYSLFHHLHRYRVKKTIVGPTLAPPLISDVGP